MFLSPQWLVPAINSLSFCMFAGIRNATPNWVVIGKFTGLLVSKYSFLVLGKSFPMGI